LINIDSLINNIIGRFNIRDGVIIHYQSNLTRKLINADAYIIDTVISNLIDNAIKYSDQPANIQIITTTLYNVWQIQVIDNGIGISDNDIPYIFDKFYRVNSGNLHDVKGYGLGLSYVKLLINTLNGSISAKSKLGSGTEFMIELPDNE
jgi:two-component system phosphate regulon sensor histidine kinase PhoR